MTIKELQNKWEGKTYAENAQFWFQCVSRAKKAIRELYWITLWSFWWSAHNWFITGSPFTAPWWTKFVNTPEKVPVPWSVIFRSKSWQLPYWHVAIVLSADVDTVTVQEQNWADWSWNWLLWNAIRTKQHSYHGVSWWYTYRYNPEATLDKEIMLLKEHWIFNWDMQWLDKRTMIIIWRVYDKLRTK